MTPDEVVALAKARGQVLQTAEKSLFGYGEASRALAEHGIRGERGSPAWNLYERNLSWQHTELEHYNRVAIEARRALSDVHIKPESTLVHDAVAHVVDVIAEATFTDKWGPQVLSSAKGLIHQGIGEWQRIEKDPSLYPLPPPPPPISEADVEARVEKRIRDEYWGHAKWFIGVFGVLTVGAIAAAVGFYVNTKVAEKQREMERQRWESDQKREREMYQEKLLRTQAQIRECGEAKPGQKKELAQQEPKEHQVTPPPSASPSPQEPPRRSPQSSQSSPSPAPSR